MSDPNLVIWASDWHSCAVVDSGTYTLLAPGQALAYHLTALHPSHIVISGDCRHRFGVLADLTSFRDDAYSLMTPLPLVLPGNHDEEEDTGVGTTTNFTDFDATFHAAPYHWTADWGAPNVRLIGFHSYIIHTGAQTNYAQVDASETAWLTAQLAALGAGQKAILFTHFPLVASFGNNIHASYQGTQLLALLAANNTKVVAYCGGHRHANPTGSAVQDGILHINGAGAAATQTGAGVHLLEYRPSIPDIRVHLRNAAAPYGERGAAVYTPLTIAL